MSAVTRINEYNGAGATLNADIANLNFGSSDTSELDPVAFPINAGENSFEKYVRLEVTNMNGVSAVRKLKVWRTGALGANASLLSNARETSYANMSYGTPVATASSKATQTVPATEPTGANLGIGGSLAGELTAVGLSDYLVLQLQTTGSATDGASFDINIQRDEVA